MEHITMENIEIILDKIIGWVEVAGNIQLEYFRTNNLNIEIKSSAADVVTIADKKSESYLIGQIKELYPDHEIVGEETGRHEGNSPYRWVIDPLDGTTNYSQGLPIFTISIGLQYDGDTVLGVVYAPYLKELYTAIKGKGAFLNGKPIRVSTKKELATSVLGTGFPVDKHSNPDNNIDNFSVLVPQVRCVRRLGSAAYDLCCTAGGYLDGYWESNLNEWDVCAGILIAQEAGAIVKPYRTDRKISIVAGNADIVNILLSYLVKETL